MTKAQRKQLKQLAHTYKKTLRQRERYLKKITQLDKKADQIAGRMVSLEVGSCDGREEKAAH